MRVTQVRQDPDADEEGEYSHGPDSQRVDENESALGGPGDGVSICMGRYITSKKT